MAPADDLALLAAAAAAPASTTTLSKVLTKPTMQIIVNTITATEAATTATRTTLHASHIFPTSIAATPTATPTGSTCWPGTCSSDIAVSFGPFPDDDSSRFVSTWGGAAFAGAFGLLVLAHLVQGCHYRWKPATAAVSGGLAAMAGYILQATGSVSTVEPSIQPYLLAAAFVLLQLAPLCITLYAYLLLERLAHTRFLPAHDSLEEASENVGRRRQKKVWPSNGRWIAHWSVVALLACASAAQAVAVAFLVYGGLTTTYVGHVLLVAADLVWAAGLAAQGLVVLILLTAVTQAFATLPPARPGGQQERGVSGAVPALSLPPRRRVQLLWLLCSTYGVLALLTMRLVYRTVEAVLAAEGKGAVSITPKQVVYALVFEALPTCLALALLSAFHAGWALPLRDVHHLLPTGEGAAGGGGGDSGTISRRGTDREDEAAGGVVAAAAAGAAGEGGGLSGPNPNIQAPVPEGTPLEPRGVRFGLPPPTLTPAQILIQQRAIIQRQRQQQRQQWQRQWQRHREEAAMGQAMQSVSLPSSPVVEALARSSLSASLTVSLPRESFVAERPDLEGAELAGGGEHADVGRGEDRAPRLLARLSRDNFILFRFLNAPSRSPSSHGGNGGGWRTRTRTTASGSRRSRRTPHSNSHSAPSHRSESLADDPFVGFDGVGTAGRYDYDGGEYYDVGDNDNNNNKDNDSHRTCDSPDEKRGASPEWP
ncbi:hypothetical protein SBRCBS47491_003403 [Sporothrix bragantina]|uniref:Uncharacterized protein n=1 Tax=Sporothrix bragantina TaxID=671064 RepID=A0ABP0BF48_9PEZI